MAFENIRAKRKLEKERKGTRGCFNRGRGGKIAEDAKKEKMQVR